MPPSPKIIPYDIKPTPMVPNSQKPLLLYKNCFPVEADTGKVSPTHAYDSFTSKTWCPQWVTSYGQDQKSHYHPNTHETMVVLSGPGTIRWGDADLSDDENQRTQTDDHGVEMEVHAGDLFVIPAGIAHKSFNRDSSSPGPICLTGGGAHRIESDGQDPREAVAKLDVSGFTMMGAYPRGFEWSWAEAGDHVGRFEKVWNVDNADMDPFFGDKGGILEYWK